MKTKGGIRFAKRPVVGGFLLALALLVGLIGGGSSAQASTTVVLDFEGLGNFETILDFYDGGFGGFGSGPGPDFDTTFGPDALALIDADAGGSGNFANEPSADTIAFFLTGPGVVMNVTSGFTTGFSFFYTSSQVGTVTVFDGPNGTGTVLATVPVEIQHTTCGASGDPGGTFACWTPVGVTFSGTAFSVNFGGVSNQTGFDEITLGSATPGEVPLDISKELLEGPEQIGIYLPDPTQYVFEIAYSNPDPATPVRVTDTVPAEFEILSLNASAGSAVFFDTSRGRGNSANRIEWDLPVGTTTATLTVEIQTVASPGGGHRVPVFKPTSCGPLPINDGATAFEVDPDTGEIVRVEVVDPVTGEVTLEPVVIVGPSNALEVEAVEGAKPCVEVEEEEEE